MGDLQRDTEIEGAKGRYRATLSEDWAVWGPNGGYLAAIALRAAAAESRLPRPATFAAHYLAVAKFAPVDLEVTALRRGKRAESFQVLMSQEGAAIVAALVWTTEERPGLDHDFTITPEVPPPKGLRNTDELRGEPPLYRFWNNLEQRPLSWDSNDPPAPTDPEFRSWFRYRPRACFADPFVDAARALILIDTLIWPAAWRHHLPQEYYAPSLDVVAWFHRPAIESEWLFADARAPLGRDGLIAGRADIWSATGELVASGGSQLACVSNRAFAR